MNDRQVTIAKLAKRGQRSNPEAKARYQWQKAFRKERQAWAAIALQLAQTRIAALSPDRPTWVLKADLRAAAVHLLWVRRSG